MTGEELTRRRDYIDELARRLKRSVYCLVLEVKAEATMWYFEPCK